MSKGFWDGVCRRFHDLEEIIKDLNFPDKRDTELYQLHYLIHGQWPRGLHKYHQFYYPQPESQMLAIIRHLATLNLPLPEKYVDNFLFKDEQSRNIRKIIADALEHQQISEEFVTAWGSYNFSVAAVLSFLSRDSVDNHEKANVKKNIPSLIERYIFAFWMHRHWVNGTCKKERARDALADRIVELLQSNDQFPAWKEDAFRNMLADDESGIKKTFTDISRNEIISMVGAADNLKHLFEIE